MKNISLYIPKIEDYWYEEKIQSDSETMKYNAGYDVLYYGYHYDTGCIDFPKEKWKEVYNKRFRENRYFAYVKDMDSNEFVGYVNYQYNKNEDRYYCGVVIENKYRGQGYARIALRKLIEEAKKNNITTLYDNFEEDRINAVNLFLSVGFKIVERQKWKKFGKEVNGILIKYEE